MDTFLDLCNFNIEEDTHFDLRMFIFQALFWTFVGNVREVTVPWYIEMIVAFELMNIDC